MNKYFLGIVIILGILLVFFTRKVDDIYHDKEIANTNHEDDEFYYTK